MKREMSSRVLGAKNIRKELKAKFPGIKFSVQSESFAGGDAIDIDWTDGPTREEVEKIIAKYRRGNFDGMTDSYTRHTRSPEGDKRGGAMYVQSQRHYSDETMEKTGRELCRKQNIEYEGDGTRYLYGQQDYERLSVHVDRELSKKSFDANSH